MDYGFEVVEAADGEVAVAALDDPDAFDAIVTDIHMPGDGMASPSAIMLASGNRTFPSST